MAQPPSGALACARPFEQKAVVVVIQEMSRQKRKGERLVRTRWLTPVARLTEQTVECYAVRERRLLPQIPSPPTTAPHNINEVGSGIPGTGWLGR